MRILKNFLREYPTNLRVTSGKAKKLRGRLQDYYQYDVTYSDRVRYQVDKKSRAVKIAYAGGHP
jgi:Txe/YoeB family toxin of Txe-Axe toxin-antitoxin module